MMDPNYYNAIFNTGLDSNPYFNDAYLNEDDKYIKLEGADVGNVRKQLAFNQIGLSAIGGASIGGTYGLFNGLSETKKARITGAVRRGQLMNYVVKKGSGAAQSLGAIAVIYNLFGVSLTYVRGVDDELNTLAAAATTGVLYKSTGGLFKAVRGGAIGLGIAAAYCFIMRRDEVKKMIGLK